LEVAGHSGPIATFSAFPIASASEGISVRQRIQYPIHGVRNFFVINNPIVGRMKKGCNGHYFGGRRLAAISNERNLAT
jgi:hypothetical protein